ncbi:hypothetical protein [Pedobacter miscanthi]|uniref:hypothetical protein n=1 Tax=Pedobacter miscanthi TaxID=2259170 RepID=UPI00292D413F|nr:hypothetical protein [Pedobacter miscanthi]
MLKILFLLFISLSISIGASAATGCLVLNFDTYNKVFNNPETSTQFYTGNGNNFVWWEGVCGPHTYLATSGASLGPCTLNGSTKTGQIYSISETFMAPCGLPLDSHEIFLLFFSAFMGVFVLRYHYQLNNKSLIKVHNFVG